MIQCDDSKGMSSHNDHCGKVTAQLSLLGCVEAHEDREEIMDETYGCMESHSNTDLLAGLEARHPARHSLT